jgi:hypothetical protein
MRGEKTGRRFDNVYSPSTLEERGVESLEKLMALRVALDDVDADPTANRDPKFRTPISATPRLKVVAPAK